MSRFVKEYYNTHTENEWNRLDKPLCKIEFASTLRLIERYFPAHGRICDIGGGPGRYTLELLRRGYAVTLFDLSEAEIRFARALLQKNGLAAEEYLVGDARDLGPLADASFDAALLMGPMYHILEPKERATALHELKRILKPGSPAIIAYLNSWGILKTGLTDMPDQYQDNTYLHSMLNERAFAGQNLSGFTECYWSTPDLALDEIKQAGLEVVNYIGAEGFAGGLGIQLERLATEMPAAYENVVRMAAETSELAQYRDATDHLHIVARKNEGNQAIS